MSTIADQVGYFLGTHGPSVTLEVACGSSIVALALAANSLQAGDCDYALVLGACAGCCCIRTDPFFLIQDGRGGASKTPNFNVSPTRYLTPTAGINFFDQKDFHLALQVQSIPLFPPSP